MAMMVLPLKHDLVILHDGMTLDVSFVPLPTCRFVCGLLCQVVNWAVLHHQLRCFPFVVRFNVDSPGRGPLSALTNIPSGGGGEMKLRSGPERVTCTHKGGLIIS